MKDIKRNRNIRELQNIIIIKVSLSSDFFFACMVSKYALLFSKVRSVLIFLLVRLYKRIKTSTGSFIANGRDI
ncbi:hypothetical protein D3C87_1669400 [compost metagenome]